MNSIKVRLRVFILILIAVVFTGTIGFMALEGLTLFDSLYFTVVTVATVGYGDITATTQAGGRLRCSSW
jgi:voltage-gated potassium channel